MPRGFSWPVSGRSVRIASLLLVGAGLAVGGPASAHKYKFRTLYSFCAEANCADGGGSLAALVMDQAGNLYGTSPGGGANGQGGTVFELVPSGHNWKHKTLYSFCSLANCADGDGPAASLIVDTSGDLYGTTRRGGPYGNDAGTAFELIRKGNRWRFKQLYAFCAQQPCLDGNAPSSGLAYLGAAAGSPYDGTSALFGTTVGGGGGDFAPEGVAFRLEPQNNRWKQTVVYNFCSATDCADGASPNAPVLDSAGRLWGTTSSGGDDRGGGVLYSISGRNESVEYDFCSVTENCLDGAFPTSPVFLDNFGRIVGTTPLGGSTIANGPGTLFAVSGGQEQVLHIFCSKANCADGEYPTAGVIEDSAGEIFGVTETGGDANGDGVAFEFSGGGLHVLHTFGSEAGGADGCAPVGGLIMDASGNLYGTTSGCGAFSAGTVFELEN